MTLLGPCCSRGIFETIEWQCAIPFFDAGSSFTVSNQNPTKKTKESWPTDAAMRQVYSAHLWGGREHDFYSGEGSHLAELVDPYVEVVKAFLSSFDPRLTVCDLGCGDFNVGRQLVEHTAHYTAVDIVPELIERNRQKYSDDGLEFHCLNLATDPLPSADCAVVRQVLQHLSNAEVHTIAQKLLHYRYVILTEHLPDSSFVPNKDIISGQGTRLKKKSGVNLLAPPFELSVKEQKALLSIALTPGKGRIVTTLLRFF